MARDGVLSRELDEAGIGTASSIAPSIGAAAGILVQSNFYPLPGLVMNGVPVGDLLGEPRGTRHTKAGSCITVVAVDARSRRISSRASHVAPGSASRAAAASRITAAARSSSPLLLRVADRAVTPRALRSATTTSTTSSTWPSTQPRRPF
jgi:hypothetical protein